MKFELYGRYVDDNKLILRSIGRKVKFCPLAGKLVDKSDDEIKAKEKMKEDKIRLIEARKIIYTCLEKLKAESDYPSNHPELGNKVLILNMAV